MWKEMDSAPRDGTPILVARNNDVSWEFYVVWWTRDPVYPWSAEWNAYPEERLDYWRPLPEPPYDIWATGDGWSDPRPAAEDAS
jgi:hypothetical protein